MPEFTTLNYASFEQTVQPYCKQLVELPDKAGESSLKPMEQWFVDRHLLLAAGMRSVEDETRLLDGDGRTGGLSAAVLSKFRTGKRDLYQKIVSAYLEEGTVDIVKEHFETNLLPALRNSDSVTTVLRELATIISADIDIPDKYQARFRVTYDEDDPCAFLAETFVFALTRNVILKGTETPRLNPIVQEVLKLAKKELISSMLRPLIDQLYQYATEGLSVFDPIEFYLEDYRAFVAGVVPVEEQLEIGYRLKISRLRSYLFHRDAEECNAKDPSKDLAKLCRQLGQKCRGKPALLQFTMIDSSATESKYILRVDNGDEFYIKSTREGGKNKKGRMEVTCKSHDAAEAT